MKVLFRSLNLCRVQIEIETWLCCMDTLITLSVGILGGISGSCMETFLFDLTAISLCCDQSRKPRIRGVCSAVAWLCINTEKFNKDKSKVPQLGQTNTLQRYQLESGCGAALLERTWGIMESRLPSVSQQCALAVMGANTAQQERSHRAEGSDCSSTAE